MLNICCWHYLIAKERFGVWLLGMRLNELPSLISCKDLYESYYGNLIL